MPRFIPVVHDGQQVEGVLASHYQDLCSDYHDLKSGYETLENQYKKAKKKIEFYEEQIRLLRHQRFGRSSEKTSPGQGVLFSEEEAPEPEQTPDDDTIQVSYERPQNPHRKRNQFPIHWPRREVLHDLPEQDKLDADGQPLKVIGYDEFEQVRIEPATYEVVIHKRPKYAREQPDGHTQILQAPPAIVPLPKSFATPSLLADIITAKFVEHLPLNRYEQRSARQGLTLPRSTQARWLIQLCDEQQPLNLLVKMIREHIIELNVARGDETRFQVFNDTDRANPASDQAYAWLLTGIAEYEGQAITLSYYQYAPSKDTATIDQLLEDFKGYFVCDGYSGFDRLQRLRQDTDTPLILCGCWDHARRRFKQAEKALKKGDQRTHLTHQGVALINKLYAIEREIKNQPPDQKYEYRQQHSIPALEKLKTWLVQTQPKLNPKSALGDAVAYTLNQWDKLVRFTDHGDIPLSNILCEQQAKKFAVGRKNWMFSHTPAGARASCMLYTLAVTACMNQVNPFHYFRYILAVLPTVETVAELEALLPWRVDKEAIAQFDEFSYCQGKPC